MYTFWSGILNVLLIGSFLCIVVGWLKPMAVLGGEKRQRTRKRAVLAYGSLFILLLLIKLEQMHVL
ncbi:MAG: hypothetical protein RhofKO_22220 [Rhodothermales bacterium]